MQNRPMLPISLQNEEIKASGCCLSSYFHPDQVSQSPSRVRVYSQRKDSRQKKMEVVTAKRGHSQSKESIHLRDSHSRAKNDARGDSNLKEEGKYSLQCSTKVTASRNSLRSSEVNTRCLRIEKSSEEFKNQPLSTNSTAQHFSENRQSQPLLQRNNSNFNGISEIQIISEEFVSQGSSTIKLVSALTQGQNRQPQERQPFRNVNNRQVCNMNALCTKPPLKQSMVIDRRKPERSDCPKKRLVL